MDAAHRRSRRDSRARGEDPTVEKTQAAASLAAVSPWPSSAPPSRASPDPTRSPTNLRLAIPAAACATRLLDEGDQPAPADEILDRRGAGGTRRHPGPRSASHTTARLSPAHRARGRQSTRPTARAGRPCGRSIELLAQLGEALLRGFEHLARAALAVTALARGRPRRANDEARLTLADLVLVVVAAAREATCGANLGPQEQRAQLPGHV